MSCAAGSLIACWIKFNSTVSKPHKSCPDTSTRIADGSRCANLQIASAARCASAQPPIIGVNGPFRGLLRSSLGSDIDCTHARPWSLGTEKRATSPSVAHVDSVFARQSVMVNSICPIARIASKRAGVMVSADAAIHC